MKKYVYISFSFQALVMLKFEDKINPHLMKYFNMLSTLLELVSFSY